MQDDRNIQQFISENAPAAHAARRVFPPSDARDRNSRVDALIYPVFVVEGRKQRQPVASMPGSRARSRSTSCCANARTWRGCAIPAIALFPVTPAEKKIWMRANPGIPTESPSRRCGR